MAAALARAEARVRELEALIAPVTTGDRRQETRYVYGPISRTGSSVTYGAVGERLVTVERVLCQVCGGEQWCEVDVIVSEMGR